MTKLSKMFATTPSTIGDSVYQLREKLGLNTDPVFVPVRDTQGHKLNDCYFNVERKIAKNNGAVQYGWSIWEAPRKFIEAEFHAVWVSPSGEFVDITPHADGEEQILFIPDPTKVYAKEPVDNVRLPLCDDPKVLAMIEMQEKFSKLRTKYNDGTGNSQIPVDALREAFGFVTPSNPSPTSIPKIQAERNALCPCGSKIKFKKCHGAPKH